MRPLFYFPASLLSLACFSQPVFAVDCSVASTTLEVNECASIGQQKMEAKLNTTYQRIMKLLDKQSADDPNAKASKTALIEAQRAWIKFREADCNAVYQYYIDGTIRTVMSISCMSKHAERRIKDLEEYERH